MTLDPRIRALHAKNNLRLWMIRTTWECELKILDAMNSYEQVKVVEDMGDSK